MTTATRPRRTKKSPAAQPAVTKKPAGDGASRDLMRFHKIALVPQVLRLAAIDPSPYQPRQSFAEGEIARLGELMAAQGQLVDLIVRHSPDKVGRYELIDGERRLRAARGIGWKAIGVQAGNFSDAEARAIVLVTGSEAKPLSQVEQGIAFQRMLDAGDASGPTELAAKLGLSQGHISNCIALLRLPESIRRLNISGEMSLSLCRKLLPLAAAPDLCDQVVREARDGEGRLTSSEDELGDAIGNVLFQTAGDMDTRRYTGGHFVTPYEPTDAEREQLHVVEIPGYDGKPAKWALNKKLWKELQGAREKEIAAKARAKSDKADKADRLTPAAEAGGKQVKKKKPPTEAELKRLAEADRKRKAESARRRDEQLYHFAIDFRRWAIAEALASGDVSPEHVLRLLCVWAAKWSIRRYDPVDRRSCLDPSAHALEEALRLGGAKYRGRDFWAAVAAVAEADVPALAGRFLAGCFYDQETGPQRTVPGEDVLRVCDDLGIDLHRLWLDHQCGPLLSERYWPIRSRDELAEYCKAHKVEATGPNGPKKSDYIAACLARIPAAEDDASTAGDKALPFPKELAKPKKARKEGD